IREQTLMILPRPRAIMRGATARVTRKALVRSASITSRHCASVISSSGARRWIPALLIRTSTGATSASTRAIAAATAAPSVTSKAAVATRAPSPRSPSAAAASFASSRPLSTSAAPAAARPRARPSPMPWLEPVTRTVRPGRSKREPRSPIAALWQNPAAVSCSALYYARMTARSTLTLVLFALPLLALGACSSDSTKADPAPKKDTAVSSEGGTTADGGADLGGGVDAQAPDSAVKLDASPGDAAKDSAPGDAPKDTAPADGPRDAAAPDVPRDMAPDIPPDAAAPDAAATADGPGF